MSTQEQLLTQWQTFTSQAKEKMCQAVQEFTLERYEVAAKYTRESVMLAEKASDVQMSLLHHIMKTKKLERGGQDAVQV